MRERVCVCERERERQREFHSEEEKLLEKDCIMKEEHYKPKKEWLTDKLKQRKKSKKMEEEDKNINRKRQI